MSVLTMSYFLDVWYGDKSKLYAILKSAGVKGTPEQQKAADLEAFGKAFELSLEPLYSNKNAARSEYMFLTMQMYYEEREAPGAAVERLTYLGYASKCLKMKQCIRANGVAGIDAITKLADAIRSGSW